MKLTTEKFTVKVLRQLRRQADVQRNECFFDLTFPFLKAFCKTDLEKYPYVLSYYPENNRLPDSFIIEDSDFDDVFVVVGYEFFDFIIKLRKMDKWPEPCQNRNVDIHPDDEQWVRF